METKEKISPPGRPSIDRHVASGDEQVKAKRKAKAAAVPPQSKTPAGDGAQAKR